MDRPWKRVGQEVGGVLPSPWRSTVEDLIRAVEASGADAAPRQPCVEPHDPVPFEDLLAPLVDHAARRLEEHAGSGASLLGTNAMAALERHLLVSLAGVSGRCLYRGFAAYRAARVPAVAWLTGGTTARTCYDGFITSLRRGALREFLLEYSALGPLLAVVIDNWVANTAALAHRLEADRDALERAFCPGPELGRLVGIRPGLSDWHDGGKTVAELTFSGGLRLYYKPRPVAFEAVWSRLVRWFEARGAPVPLFACQVLERDGYGWMAAAVPTPCDDEAGARRFYERAGGLLAAAAALGTIDLHMENVIACGDRPVPVDLETLLQPGFSAGIRAGSLPQPLRLFEPALLPMAISFGGGPWFDPGAMGCAGKQPTGGCAGRWRLINTDAMTLAADEAVLMPAENLPVVEGRRVPAWEHADAVAGGLRRMGGWLAEHGHELLGGDSPLSGAGAASVRFIFRPTMTYEWLLSRSLEPELLRGEVERAGSFEPLERILDSPDAARRLRPIVAAERRALERLDVPYFLVPADSDVLRLKDGSAATCFDLSAQANAAARLVGTGPSGGAAEARLLRTTLAAARVRAVGKPVRERLVLGTTIERGLVDLGRRNRFPDPSDRLALGSRSGVLSPYCVGIVRDPETVAAAIAVGINGFFVSADLHWGSYRHTIEGLRRAIRAKPSLRADLVILGVSYANHPPFMAASLAELLASAPEFGSFDAIVAGGCGPLRPASPQVFEEYCARSGASPPPARAASFHHRVSALEAVLGHTLDLAFVRYNPVHPGASRDLFPLMPEATERPVVLGFLSTFGFLDDDGWSALKLPPDSWRPRRSDFYRFALTRPQLDGLLIAPAVPSHIDTLLEAALRHGPLDPDEEAYLMALARRGRRGGDGGR